MVCAQESDTSATLPFQVAIDGNGNVTTLTDETGTNITARYEYDPFGRLLSATGEAADDNPWRFSTKMYEDDWGLGYWGYRWYSPETGRWSSRDPIGERAFFTVHTQGERYEIRRRLAALARKPAYLFVANQPVGKMDYLGLMGCCRRPPKDAGKPKIKTCEEICAEANEEPTMNAGGGGVICCGSTKCPCAFDQPDVGIKRGQCPAIDKIVVNHEEKHMPEVTCDPTKDLQRPFVTGNEAAIECPHVIQSWKELKAAMKNEQDATCKAAMEAIMTQLEVYINTKCDGYSMDTGETL